MVAARFMSVGDEDLNKSRGHGAACTVIAGSVSPRGGSPDMAQIADSGP